MEGCGDVCCASLSRRRGARACGCLGGGRRSCKDATRQHSPRGNSVQSGAVREQHRKSTERPLHARNVRASVQPSSVKKQPRGWVSQPERALFVYPRYTSRFSMASTGKADRMLFATLPPLTHLVIITRPELNWGVTVTQDWPTWLSTRQQ